MYHVIVFAVQSSKVLILFCIALSLWKFQILHTQKAHSAVHPWDYMFWCQHNHILLSLSRNAFCSSNWGRGRFKISFNFAAVFCVVLMGVFPALSFCLDVSPVKRTRKSIQIFQGTLFSCHLGQTVVLYRENRLPWLFFATTRDIILKKMNEPSQ